MAELKEGTILDFIRRALGLHAAAADPHPGYQLEAEKDKPSGYAGLDASGKVPLARLDLPKTEEGEPSVQLGSVLLALLERLMGTTFSDHKDGSDEHPGYQLRGEKDQPGGYPSLDATGKVPTDRLELPPVEPPPPPAPVRELTDGDIPGSIARVKDLADVVASVLPSLTPTKKDLGKSYQRTSEKGEDSGYAPLDEKGKVPRKHLAIQEWDIPASIARRRDVSAAAAGPVTISRGGTLYKSDGLVAGVDVIVWQAPFACTVTKVYGYRTGGTGATINARKNGALDHLAGDLSVGVVDTWVDGGAVVNTGYVAGDKMEIRVVTVAGSPTQVAIQVDATKL